LFLSKGKTVTATTKIIRLSWFGR